MARAASAAADRERARLPRVRLAALAGLLLGLAGPLAGCGFDALDPFAEAAPSTPLADSAAKASQQTYALLQRAQRLQARQAARAPQAETPAEAASLQMAALPPSSAPGIVLRLSFPESRGALSSDSQADLVALGAQLQREPDLPIKILAYWSSDDDEQAAAAKLHALKRAMLVRDFLADQGLARARIDFSRLEEAETPPWIVDVVVDRR